MKLVINTQYEENYAAHDEDYVHGVSESRWKFKGGDTYVVENFDFNTSDTTSIVTELEELICFSNPGAEMYIIDWEIKADSESVCEDWETPHIMLPPLVKGGYWTCTMTTNNHDYMLAPVIEKKEVWTMLPKADRDKYMVEYLMENGDLVLGHDGFTKWLSKQEVA